MEKRNEQAKKKKGVLGRLTKKLAENRIGGAREVVEGRWHRCWSEGGKKANSHARESNGRLEEEDDS